MENININDFFEFKSISNLKLSPDGNTACFIIHEANHDENTYIRNLWIYDLVELNYYLLESTTNVINFIWLSDNEHIIFTKAMELISDSSNKELTIFFKINIKKNIVKKIFSISKTIFNFYEICNDSLVFTSITNINTSNSDEVKDQIDSSIILEEIPFSQNGRGYINKIRNKLYVYHINENKIESLTNDFEDVVGFDVNESRCKLAFTSVSYLDKRPLENSIFIYDFIAKNLKKITKDQGSLYDHLHFCKHNTLIFSKNDMTRYGLSQDKKFYLFDEEKEIVRCLTPNNSYSLTNALVTDTRIAYLSKTSKSDQNYFYFIDLEETHSCLYKLDSAGSITKLINFNGNIDDFDIKNNTITFVGLRNFRLQELYHFHNNEILQLTNFNEEFYKKKTVCNIKKLSVNVSSQLQIDGWIMSPISIEKDKKYPAILHIHSGPKAIYGECFYHEMQLLASCGFVILFCNPRGSDGKGNDFADIRSNCGYLDHDDLMKFTDASIHEYPFIDQDRIGVIGASYGGYLTNWIIGHTNKFKAAISISGISNWVTMALTSDIGYFYVKDILGETLWNNIETYWDHSPIKYANKVKTPTLFIHADEDYRCGLVESMQMFSALKLHGIDSRLCIIKNANHSINSSGRPKERIIKLQEIIKWFRKYLL